MPLKPLDRRTLLRSDALDRDDRRALEQLGALQGRSEVRFNVARAYRDVGKPKAAAAQSMLATAMLDSLFSEARHLTRVQDERAAESLRGVRRAMTVRRSSVSRSSASMWARSSAESLASAKPR